MDLGSWTTCFSPEAEGAEGALSMPDVKMGNELATAVIHILPTWKEDRHRGPQRAEPPQVCKEGCSVAGAIQGAVVKDTEGAKSGWCLK